MARIYEDITKTTGNTPLVKLNICHSLIRQKQIPDSLQFPAMGMNFISVENSKEQLSRQISMSLIWPKQRPATLTLSMAMT